MTEVGQVGGYDEYTSWIGHGHGQSGNLRRWVKTHAQVGTDIQDRRIFPGAVVTFPHHEKTEQWTNQNLWWFVSNEGVTVIYLISRGFTTEG